MPFDPVNPPYPPRELRRLRRVEDRKPLNSAILAPVVMRTLHEVAGRTSDLDWLLVGPLAAQAYHESRVVLEIDALVATIKDADRFVEACESLARERQDSTLIVDQQEIPFDVILRIHSSDSTNLPPEVVKGWIEMGKPHGLGDRSVRVAEPEALFCLLIKQQGLYTDYDARELHRLHGRGLLGPNLYSPEQFARAKELAEEAEYFNNTGIVPNRDGSLRDH